MPIVSAAHDRQVAGQERVRPPGEPDRDREQHRVDRLGHEQVGDPLDVGDDAPAFGDDARQRREAAVEQHDLGDRARRRRAVAHRDADVGVLQRERVVDAVAGHRDDVPTRLQRADDRALLVRRDPAEHGRVLEHVGERVLVLGELARVDGVAVDREADARARPRRPCAGCRRR